MPFFLLAFIIVPLVELFAIGQVAAAVGLGPTILLLVADSLLGAWLLRREGRRAWAELTTALAGGRWPGDEIMQGALVLVGGTLLLTPGFVTDVVGFALLVPVTRRLLAAGLRDRVQPRPLSGFRVVGGMSGGATGGFPAGFPGTGRPGGDVREADVVDVEAEIVSVERDTPPELT